jgi:phosphatidylserine synthase
MSAITICSIVLLKLKLDSIANVNEFIFNPKEFNIFDLNIILPTIILLSFLMIGKIHFSKFPLFSFKHSQQNTIRLFLLIIMFAILAISKIYGYFYIGLFLFSSYYILSNILFHFINNSIKLNQLRQTLKNKKRNL